MIIMSDGHVDDLGAVMYALPSQNNRNDGGQAGGNGDRQNGGDDVIVIE